MNDPRTGWTPEQLIAFARECLQRLPDDHPAKVTRERIADLHAAVTVAESVGGGDLSSEFAFVDAIEEHLLPAGA